MPPTSRPSSSQPASRTPSSMRSTSGARASTPAESKTRHTTAKKTTPSQKAWQEAEKIIPDLDAAVAFLHDHTLIPEGTHAYTGTALISGLLHLASVAPTTLSRQGLIALAHLATELFAREAQTAVSAEVVERAEDQLRLRLDEHTSHVEQRMEELEGTIAGTQKELRQCAAELREACEGVRHAERALMEAKEVLAVTPTVAAGTGTSPPPAQMLTLETAPARVRRAATLADLLQRQILIRGATLTAEDGAHFKDGEVLDRARQALDAMEQTGLSPPNGGTLESAKILPHHDVVITASSSAMARWILKPSVAKPFARKMGLTAQVLE
ncbi:hypothetical protein L227DRAFT_514581, partial [Lentinus tigrinus ALCF2SS1-6]